MAKSKAKGTCQACLQMFAVDEEMAIARHGYQRPGDGHEHGRCSGSGHKPLEIDKAICEAFLLTLESWHKRASERAKEWKDTKEVHVVRSTSAYDKALGFVGYGRRRQIVHLRSTVKPTGFEGKPLEEALALGAEYTHGPWVDPKTRRPDGLTLEQSEEHDRCRLRGNIRELEIDALEIEKRDIKSAIKQRMDILRDWKPKPLVETMPRRVRIDESTSATGKWQGAFTLLDQKGQRVQRGAGCMRRKEVVRFASREAAERWAKQEGMEVVETF